jgi:hypothetical protein
MTTQNALFNRQYALIAKRTGNKCNFYRPASATNPLQTAYLQQYASFNQDYRYSKPNKYGNAQWYGMFDSSSCQVGDIIDGVDGTFFIAAIQNCLPILLVQCNRTISVLRVAADTSVGIGGYGGDTSANETVLMSGWPASILQGTKSEANDAKLPGDVRTPWWAILFPAFDGVVLRTSDIITDDIGRRYIISSAELTDMGWRITAMQAQV